MAFVGLDIGTCNCCCYVAFKTAPPELISSQLGHHLTPSMVAYTPKEILVGEMAQQQQGSNPNYTFYEFKRVLGRKFDEAGLSKDAKHWPFQLTRHTDGTPQYVALHQNKPLLLNATQLYEQLAQHMTQLVRQHTKNEPVASLVVTVPAHFDHNQRRETLQVLKNTHVATHVHVCNEPTAAAAAYAEKYDNLMQVDERVLVFDLGAGTLDVTILNRDADGTFAILGSQGVSDLGGADFDRHLLHHYSQFYKKQTHANLNQHKTRLVAARQACEQAKKILSLSQEATVALPDVPVWTVTREQFNQWLGNELERCSAVVQATLALTTHTTIQHLILVGGSSRVPAVQALLQALFPSSTVHKSINVDECVALGACYLARALHQNTEAQPHERLSQSLGLRTMTNTMHVLIPANTPLPASVVQTLYPQHERQKTVEIALFQGDNACTDHNALVGSVKMTGMRPGQPPVQLRVHINAGGMIDVVVQDDKGRTVESTIHI